VIRNRKVHTYPRVRDLLARVDQTRGRRPTEIRRLLNRIAISPRTLSRLLAALEWYQKQDRGQEKLARESMRAIIARAETIEDWYREHSKLAERVGRLEEWQTYLRSR
jgi:phytoene dehydrogenase-like protein